MANVTIQVPDALVPRLTAALRATYPQHDALSVAAAFKAVTAAAEAAAIAAAPLAEFRANLATWFVVHILGG